MNRLIALGVALVIAGYVLFSSIYIVNIREQAIVLRLGQITAVHKDPGLYFKIPTDIIDTVQIIEDRLLRYDIANMQLQVSDGAIYVVDAFLTYRINDPVKFRERAQGDLQLAEQRVQTQFDAALRQVYAVRQFNAALSAERPEMMRETAELITPGLSELGLEVVDVRILRTDLMDDVSKQTFDRMSAERNAEAARIRAGGQQAAQSLRAIADRQAIEIVAAAQRDSEILRGEGDAQRSAIFASAFSKDPEFYEFYRSLQSYRQALGSNGTTMVLSPDSEFFRYFGSDTLNGQVPPPASPEGIAPPALTAPVVPDTAPPISTDSNAVPDLAPALTDATPPITPPGATDIAPVNPDTPPATLPMEPPAAPSVEPAPATP